jgi:hypothetical protein
MCSVFLGMMEYVTVISNPMVRAPAR